MKSWLQLYFTLFVLCLLPVASSIAASSNLESKKSSGPMAEMIFYEAAEQAVEDGYAEIIPEEPEDKTAHDVAGTNSEQAEQGSAPSEAEPRTQKK